MRNYLAAECYKTFRRKYFYIILAVCLGLEAVLLWGYWTTWKWGNSNVDFYSCLLYTSRPVGRTIRVRSGAAGSDAPWPDRGGIHRPDAPKEDHAPVSYTHLPQVGEQEAQGTGQSARGPEQGHPGDDRLLRCGPRRICASGGDDARPVSYTHLAGSGEAEGWEAGTDRQPESPAQSSRAAQPDKMRVFRWDKGKTSFLKENMGQQAEDVYKRQP